MLCIRPFADADVQFGMRLKEQADWNQLEADWRRMLDMQPDGCLVAEYDGAAAGTCMTCVFGDVAWIAMMLVEQSLRGKGIGRALMEHALGFLDGRGTVTIRLDATPMGQPLYEKLGFQAEYPLARYAGKPTGCQRHSGAQKHTRDCDELIYSLDRSATRCDRRKLLKRLIDERDCWVVGASTFRGYMLTRAGSSATQIGPCIADDIAGPILLNHAFDQHAGSPIYIDIPLSHLTAAALAREQGLTAQRQLLRMCRGPRLDERVECLWASSGPELG